jgi:hypothetical protein
LGSIISDPCPIGFVILRNKATDEENEQLMSAILSSRTFTRPRFLNLGGDGAIEVLPIERLRPRGQAQQEDRDDRN